MWPFQVQTHERIWVEFCSSLNVCNCAHYWQRSYSGSLLCLRHFRFRLIFLVQTFCEASGSGSDQFEVSSQFKFRRARIFGSTGSALATIALLSTRS